MTPSQDRAPEISESQTSDDVGHRGRGTDPTGGLSRSDIARVLITTLIAVFALIVGYEIIKRAWLNGVNTDARNSLQVMRWLCTAAISTTLATFLIFRRLDASSPHRSMPPRRRSWQARLQHAGLRTKVVVPMVALAVMATVAMGLSTVSQMRRSLREQVVQRVTFDTIAKARVVQTFLRDLHRDLRVLSQTDAIRELAMAEADGAAGRVASLRTVVERELSIFSQGRRGYQRLRYLNSEAREVLRLDASGPLQQLLPVEDLEPTIDPFYSDPALAIEPGQVYLSSVRLDPTNELASSGTSLRCATPVAWEAGIKRGLLVVELDADYFFSLVGALPSGVEAWLYNQTGNYLGYIGKSAEKKALYAMAEGRRLSADFSPDEVGGLLSHRGSAATLEIKQRLLTLAPITFDAGTAEQHWTLMISHPIAPIYTPVRQATVLLWFIVIFVAAVAANVGILIAYYIARPVAMLRRATGEIAAGNLSKRVMVTTGDEIEALATDFNAMTDRVRHAQKRLTRWNVDLQREVARQTGRLQRLQTGLARADKLASIGQMTASIMHEVGNPLAAIKTKIQVAQEGGALGVEHKTLLPDVLREVDRLSAVLRSFSRLGRLRAPVFGAVSLDEVVQGVDALITPELTRHGVALQVTAYMDATIRGDADQLRQLMINFILNAAEASPKGGEILVRVRRAGEPSAGDGPQRATIEIEDHGSGIAPEDLPRVWDPLFTTKADGTGLGLAICRQIVQDHGGTVDITSRPGEGTVVTLVFPSDGGDDSESEPRPPVGNGAVSS